MSTLYNWKNEEDFQGMVNDAYTAYFRKILRGDFGSKQHRITKLSQPGSRE